LWDDYARRIESERQQESEARSITLGEYTLRYEFTMFGDAPVSGRSLYLSLHGGGEADAATNDSQWENQQVLYEPDEGIYLSPRGPTDTWNLWHQDHIDPLFYRLITNLIVLEQVDPNRVYVMGYSAGGDGVYQLAPRMADSWAAAAMMAGHPNDAQPLSLRNIGFTIHVGGDDSAFDRNLVAAQWGTMLDELQAGDPDGYAHEVQVHGGKGHWMDLEDAVAVPWMAAFTRDPRPTRVVWLQDDVPHDRFYWLALGPEDQVAGREVVASYSGQELTVEDVDIEGELEILLSDEMLDLDQEVTVTSSAGEALFVGTVERTIATLARTLEGRGDPELVFSSSLSVRLP
jgi:poly(3-hydroxybutyrate) depolymerase